MVFRHNAPYRVSWSQGLLFFISCIQRHNAMISGRRTPPTGGEGTGPGRISCSPQEIWPGSAGPLDHNVRSISSFMNIGPIINYIGKSEVWIWGSGEGSLWQLCAGPFIVTAHPGFILVLVHGQEAALSVGSHLVWGRSISFHRDGRSSPPPEHGEPAPIDSHTGFGLALGHDS